MVGSLFVGCATPKPIPVTLDYSSAVGDPASVNLAGSRVTVSPFDDVRQSKFLVGMIVMREGDDAGTWVANALRLELERVGAQVETVSAGSRPATGTLLTGRVNDLHAVQTGWSPGGLLGAMTAGYTLKYNMTVEVMKEGIPVQTKQYNYSKNLKGDAFKNFMGGAQPISEIPPRFQIGLRELIRTQVIPDRGCWEIGLAICEK
jgi:hypothetical protein